LEIHACLMWVKTDPYGY